jgi:hypothetical protein
MHNKVKNNPCIKFEYNIYVLFFKFFFGLFVHTIFPKHIAFYVHTQ